MSINPNPATVHFSILQDRAVDSIRMAALRTLEKVGVKIYDPKVCSILYGAGATIDGDRVRIPEKVICDALQFAPSEIRFFSRDGKVISSSAGYPYHSPAPSAVAVLDYEGKRRSSTYTDVAKLTLLTDTLPGIDFISPPAIAQDCPMSNSGLLTAEATFCNTHKFCLAFALNWQEAQVWLAMAEHAGGGARNLAEKPTIGFAISPTSPLVLAQETSDILLGVAEKGLPIVTVPGGMAGATSPYSIAGTLVVEHCEALLIVALAQLIHPGTPCILGLATAVMDMVSGNISLGMAERTLILNGVAPLAHSWGLPGYAPAGLTDSHSPDEQSGGEKMLSYVTQFMSGLEFSGGVGRYEGGLSTSYEGILLDHELLQMARRYIQGIRVDEETLAEIVTARVGRSGNFLSDPHTRTLFRSNEFKPLPVFNRRSQSAGGRAAFEQAHQKVLEILANSTSPVPPAIQDDYKAIVADHIARSNLDS